MATLPADLFFLLLFGFVYAFFFTSFFFRKKYIFLCILFSFIVFYDIVFIHIAPLVSPVVFYLIKSWQEYITIFLLLTLALSQPIRPTRFRLIDTVIMSILLLLSLSGFVAALAEGNAPGDGILGWRMYLLPFVWSFLLYKTGIFEYIPSVVAKRYFIVVSLLIVFFAAWQVEMFTGDLKILWFYDYIDKLNPIAEHTFDFIRDDQLRASGIFVSPLIYSSFLSFAMLLVINQLLLSERHALVDILLVIFVCLLFYGQTLSRTRIGFIVFGISFGLSFLLYRWPRLPFFTIAALPVLFALSTITLLILGLSSDPSALGRLTQYASLPEYFRPIGKGFGAGETMVFFDSYYLSITVLFGLLTPLFLLLYYRLLKNISWISRVIRDTTFNTDDRIVYFAGVGFCLSFIYTFAFHFTTGATTFQLFVFLLFYLIANFAQRFRHKKSEAVQ